MGMKDSQTCTDGFVIQDLLLSVFAYSSCHEKKSAKEKREHHSLPTDLSAVKCPWKISVTAESVASVFDRPA
jgi:hypothetical protein